MGEGQTTAAALALSDVACVRGGRLLFEGLTFVLGPGEAAVAVGPNGAGKSSLMRVAAGLLPPAAGTVRHVGRMALLGEGAAMDAELGLAQALGFWAKLDGTGERAGAEALAALGLSPLADLPVRMLSTGQRRRAALARVVASGAALWLLDEPANGLDAGSVGVLEALIAGHRDRGGAVMVATHLALGAPGARTLALSSFPGEGRGPTAMPFEAESDLSTAGPSTLGPGFRREGV